MRARKPLPDRLDRELLDHLSSCPVADLLAEIEQLGMRLALTTDKTIEFKGSKRKLTPEHLMALTRRTAEIRGHLRGQRLLWGEGDRP